MGSSGDRISLERCKQRVRGPERDILITRDREFKAERLCQQVPFLFHHFTIPRPDPSVLLILQDVLSLCLKGRKAACLSHFPFKNIIVFTCLCSALLGLHHCAGFPLAVVSRLLTAVTSPVASTGSGVPRLQPPRRVGSVTMAPGLQARWPSCSAAPGLSCSSACGILPDQGLNPRLLHQKVDSCRWIPAEPPAKPLLWWLLRVSYFP